MHTSLRKFTVTAQGVVINGILLNKALLEELPAYSQSYVQKASALIKSMAPEDWETSRPHDPNYTPKLAQLHMLLALANPILMVKYSPDQPRDYHGRWVEEGDGDGANNDSSKSGQYQLADSGEVKTDANVDSKDNKGPFVNPDYKVNGVVGDGQCVALVKEVAGLPSTKEWMAGDAITGPHTPPLATGTAIATFDENGSYPQYNTTEKHAAIFVGYTEGGILFTISGMVMIHRNAPYVLIILQNHRIMHIVIL